MVKILILSHGHPQYSKGGAEIASWNLFNSLKSRGFECLYVARADPQEGRAEPVSKLTEDQMILRTEITDWFCLSSSHTHELFDDFGALVTAFDPDLVHVHHYAHIGIELFQSIKRAVPKAKIVFTIHEFMAICMHNGQMVKNRTYELCESPTFNDCHTCFPQHSSGDFFLRKSYILDQFHLVDAFVSPSHFLSERYIEWGLAKERMHVIENVLPQTMEVVPVRKINDGEKRCRFAFFGQINRYKGLDILLQALRVLPESIRKQVQLDIHGANLDKQPHELRENFEAMLMELEGIASMHGAYEPEQLSDLMAACDWVIIPSVWWENSPVVIQEAIALGRPLIGSNIGGMKEKIEGLAGLTFEARSPESLAERIIEAMEPGCFDSWQTKLSKKRAHLQKHVDLINQLTNQDNPS